MSRVYPVLLFISLILFTNQKFEFSALEFPSDNWNIDSTNGVYYQLQLQYCTKITSSKYQSMGLYVPKEYLTCTENSGKYKCEVNKSGKKGSYTAANAPIVMPVDTPGYAAMEAPTEYNYDDVSKYVSKGIVYAFAGCRGKYTGKDDFIQGAPWAVTDLKSAIRYLRLNKALIPGDTDRLYTFGMSGGGAQSCLMGVTGNSELFTDYLNDNGAAMTDAEGNKLKDNVKGSQCWCPITNLDTADSAYEWNLGQYYSTDSRAEGTFTKLLSDDLAQEFVKYVNNIKLKDPKGKELTLTNKNEGTYYDFLKSIIEESLNNFISDTTFPWTPDSGPGPRPRRFLQELEETVTATTYNTLDEYIAALNSNKTWVNYDKTTKKVTITSIGDFVAKCKNARKDVGAFDDLNRTQAENYVFGTNYTNGDYAKHFDNYMVNLFKEKQDEYSGKEGWDESYPSEYLNDMDDTDILGNNITYRLNMYNPMYYLNSYYAGYRKSDVADYFRINTGIFQSDTGNVVEMNLYLALLNYGKKVNFTTVWEKEHVKAERTGDSDDNFINWINQIENPDGGESFSSWIYINYFIYLISLIVLL
jgi:hypothetical protein